MHRPKRPHPITYAAAGGILTAGVVSLAARALHTFTTTFTLAPPFDWILYITAVVGVCGGGSFITWLLVRSYRHQIAQLKAENEGLRKQAAKVDELIAAVKAADEQGEINGVRIGKVLKILEERERQITEQDTQPLGRLRSIPGGGSA